MAFYFLVKNDFCDDYPYLIEVALLYVVSIYTSYLVFFAIRLPVCLYLTPEKKYIRIKNK